MRALLFLITSSLAIAQLPQTPQSVVDFLAGAAGALSQAHSDDSAAPSDPLTRSDALALTSSPAAIMRRFRRARISPPHDTKGMSEIMDDFFEDTVISRTPMTHRAPRR